MFAGWYVVTAHVDISQFVFRVFNSKNLYCITYDGAASDTSTVVSMDSHHVFS